MWEGRPVHDILAGPNSSMPPNCAQPDLLVGAYTFDCLKVGTAATGCFLPIPQSARTTGQWIGSATKTLQRTGRGFPPARSLFNDAAAQTMATLHSTFFDILSGFGNFFFANGPHRAINKSKSRVVYCTLSFCLNAAPFHAQSGCDGIRRH